MANPILEIRPCKDEILLNTPNSCTTMLRNSDDDDNNNSNITIIILLLCYNYSRTFILYSSNLSSLMGHYYPDQSIHHLCSVEFSTKLLVILKEYHYLPQMTLTVIIPKTQLNNILSLSSVSGPVPVPVSHPWTDFSSSLALDLSFFYLEQLIKFTDPLCFQSL